ncbi:MAG TPA: polysaccharide deacetylase family protein [Thermoanaerobaculales bacterium]|nr:polysaccharide deacetylase family protein [Thermoanaerobaculales bacterium]
MFAHQLSTIVGGGLNVIGPKEFFQTTRPSVMLTFDDNLLSHVDDALPVLAESGVTATFFLNPAELGRPGQLSRHDVDTLVAAGMWIGAHSNQRIVASLYSADEFRAEVASCREFLNSLGMPLAWAYPGGFIGSFTKTHDDILRQQGFSLRFSTLDEPCDPQDPDRVQGRYVIRQNCNDRYFRSALAGGLQLLRIYKRVLAQGWPASRSRTGMIDVP